MKTRIFVLGLLTIGLFSLFPARSLAAPAAQPEAEDVIQIVLVLDVSGSMGTPVYSGIVPEDLLTLLLRTREIESDPDFLLLDENLEAAKQDPAVAAADVGWRDAFTAMSAYVVESYEQSIPQVRNQVRVLLEDGGCEGYVDQAIATAGSTDQVEFSLNSVCPSGTLTEDLRQSVGGLVPYVEDPEYLALRQAWTDAARVYDEALENAGFPSAQQQVDEFRAGVGLDNLKDEIDRLVEVYSIPSRLDLAKTAAVNLIDLSALDKVNTGRDSLIGLVTFSNEAFLENELTFDYEELKATIQKWTPQEQTNIGAALQVGLSELGGADVDQPMLIILLSDGRANQGMLSPEILAAIPPQANALDATICTAGFADFEAEVDVVLLDGLAEQTDGEYLFTNSGEELGSFFIACRESILGKTLIGQFSGVIEAGDRREVGSAEVEQNTCELSLAMNFLAGTPEIHLADPTGVEVDPSTDQVTYQKGANVQLFSVKNPLAGIWGIEVSNDDLAGSPATFNMVLSTQPCTGPFVPAEEAAALSELPFLLSEEGIPVVSILCFSIVLVFGLGVFFVIRKRQQSLAKLIGGLLAVLFVICGVLSLISLTGESQAFSEVYYQDVLETQGVYDRLPEVMAEQLTYNLTANPCLEDPANCEGDGPDPADPGSGPPGYFQVLSKADWQVLLTNLLPPDWFEDQVQSVLTQTFEYVETGSGKPSISLSMTELKGRLSGEAGIQAIQQILQAQPDCSSEDLVSMTLILQGQGEPGKDFLSCNPPADFIEKNTDQLQVMLRRSLDDVPDKIDLASGFAEKADLFGTTNFLGYQASTFLVLKWIRWAISMSPLVALFLLFSIALFAAGSFQSLRTWWGIPLSLTGGIALLLALVASPIVKWASDLLLASRSLTGLSPVLVDLGTDLVQQLIGSMFLRLRTLAFVVLALGLGILIVPGFFKPKALDGPAATAVSEDPAPRLEEDPTREAKDESSEGVV